MANRPANITQAAITRALRAVKQSGMTMSVRIMPNGTIDISPAQQKNADSYDFIRPYDDTEHHKGIVM